MPELLEPRSSGGAVERIEDWLAEGGFLAAGDDALVADLHSATGCRRQSGEEPRPAPPAPCRAPGRGSPVTEASQVTQCHKSFEVGAWAQAWAAAGYCAAIEDVRAAIGRDDYCRANLVQHHRVGLGSGEVAEPWAKTRPLLEALGSHPPEVALA